MRPVVVASANGHRFKNGGPQTCVEVAYDGLVRGHDVLDALIAGVTIVELDPLDDSVGVGGLPNASVHATHLAIDVLAQVLKKLKSSG